MANSYAFTGEVLGKGGYGTVWRGRELATNSDVAVKVVPLPAASRGSVPQVDTTDDAKSWTTGEHRQQNGGLSELETMAAVGRCPGLLELKEAFLEKGTLFLVTDVMAADLCDELMSRDSPFSEDEARRAVQKLLVGIQHCHARGIAHRDIKLDNIFLKRRGEIGSVRLGDFGLAHMNSWGAPRGASGSMQYMAPEVASSSRFGKCYDGPATDMWSLGVVMFALLAKRFPFSGTSGTELKAAICTGKANYSSPAWDFISPEAKDFLQSLLAVDPMARATAKQALNHKWFDTIRSEQQNCVPTGLKPIKTSKPQPRYAPKLRGWRATVTFQTIMKRAGLSSPMAADDERPAKSNKQRSSLARLSPWYMTSRQATYKTQSAISVN